MSLPFLFLLAYRRRGRGSGAFSRKTFLTPCRSSSFCHSPTPHGIGHRRRNHRLLINRRSEDIRTPPHPATRKREGRPSSSCRLCNLGTASTQPITAITVSSS